MDEKLTINANGLKLIPLKSRVISLYPDDPERNNVQPGQLLSLASRFFKSQAWIIAYLYSSVIVGKWENNSFLFYEPKKFDESRILKLRLFDRDQELFVWKSGTVLKARLRRDDPEGANHYAIIADHVLSGTKSKILENGWIRIWENRGGMLNLPLKNAYVDSENNPKKRIHIRTNNYIGDNEAYQSTYMDCRFVGFTEGEGTEFLL